MNQKYETFPNAPIREAIFEIGIEKMPNESISDLESLHLDFLNHFPHLKPIQIIEFETNFEADGSSTISKDKSWIQGYQMWASNNQELHTCRLDGFSYNKLRPYKDGNHAILKTINGWNIFKNKFKNAKIERFAVRNINVIDIPKSRFELKDYLKLSPDIPQDLDSNSIKGFFVNVVLDFPDEKATCSITMAPQPSENDGTSILLDIEAKKDIDIGLDGVDIKSELECLRSIKDKVFFSIITDKAKGLFR